MDYELEDVSGIGKAIAERMKAAGIDSVQKLASAKPEELVKLKIKGIGEATAKKYIENAKKLFEELKGKEKLEDKKEAAPQKEEKAEEKVIAEKEKIKEIIPPDHVSKINELMKQQAECNIGIVGHVDHGMKDHLGFFHKDDDGGFNYWRLDR